jgi:hypothetical protein
LRELASDYDVAHTTLGRYFERREVAKQVASPLSRWPPRPTGQPAYQRAWGRTGCGFGRHRVTAKRTAYVKPLRQRRVSPP